MNILFIGSSGSLSLLPFKALVNSRYHLVAVGVYHPLLMNTKIIALENASLALAARQNNIPIIDLSLPVDAIVEQLSTYAIDIILMACYSKRLPDEIINHVKGNCFNLHPSLLPAFRGPEPVFWQLKLGAKTGLSWHRVVHHFDAGEIVMQQSLRFDNGANYRQINHQLAEYGAVLMLQLLAAYGSGTLSAVAQNDQQASYYRYPQAEDFSIDTRTMRSAQQAYNFICATRIFANDYLCYTGTACYRINKAIAYLDTGSRKGLTKQGNYLYIPFHNSVLIAEDAGKLRDC